MTKPPRAIILAAGNGTRLAAGGPKALLDIAGQSILERQVRALHSVGVREIMVVIGYQRDMLIAACDRLGAALDVRFSFVTNERWRETQTGYSMWLATPFMFGHPTYTLNGDVLFPRCVLAELAEARRPIALAIDEKRCGAEEVKVRMAEGGGVLAIDKRLDPAAADGEFIGIARFEGEGSSAFTAALDHELCEAGALTYYDYALARLKTPAHGVRF